MILIEKGTIALPGLPTLDLSHTLGLVVYHQSL